MLGLGRGRWAVSQKPKLIRSTFGSIFLLFPLKVAGAHIVTMENPRQLLVTALRVAVSFIFHLFHMKASSETQGQLVGTRESLTGRENMARRKVKNGEKSPWGQCLIRPVPNGRRRSGF